LQFGEQEWQGVGADCDRKPRQSNSGEFGLHPGWLGQPFSRCLAEFHDFTADPVAYLAAAP